MPTTQDEDLLDTLEMVEDRPVSTTPPTTPLSASPAPVEEGDDLSTFIESSGVKQEKTVDFRRRPWMDEHKFVLIRTIDELRALIDAALVSGRCALDLETQGLDNRIYWRSKEQFTDKDRFRAERRAQDLSELWDGFWESKGASPETIHKIVGYCLCHDGLTGYYIPVRHTADNANNIPPAEAAKEIRRLCYASQPILTEEGMREDPLASRHIATPGKVKLHFWHAKFDQEFLFPITGMEYWHPDSFEDGNLFYFCKYTSDKSLSLKDKAPEVLRTPKGHPYEMIEIKELFVSSSGKKREVDFASLHPEEAYVYGSSDAICTYLLCEKKENLELLRDLKNPKHQSIAAMYRLEKQVAQTLRGMERPRIMLDIEYVKALFKEAVEEAAGYEKEVKAIAVGRDWHDLELKSPKQLSEFLFSERGLNIEPKPLMNEASGQYKTDAETLEGLVENNPNVPDVLKTIVKFRQVDKVIGTYLTSMVNNCDSNSEIRYQFKQTGAATGRFSAPAGQPEHGYSGVPIHGIPSTYDDKKPKVATSLRKAFKARPGYTMAKVDFAGEELRIATNVAQEPVWIEEFLNGSGDLHSITARAFFNKQEVSKQERQMGKCVHPDTLICVNGIWKPIRMVGSFPETSDTFAPATGKIATGTGVESLAAVYNGGEKPLVHVVFSGGIVTCTPEHRFVLRDSSLVRAGDLEKGMLLAEVEIPVLGNRPYKAHTFSLWDGIPESNYQPNHDWSYFAGMFAGDGTCTASAASMAHGRVDNIDAYGNAYDLWVQTMEHATKACGFTTTRNWFDRLYLGSRVFVRFLREMGMASRRNKRLSVPSWILEAGIDAFLYYLAGLIDTDGSYQRKGNNYEWTTKNFTFAGQVGAACRAAGLSFNTELQWNKKYQRHYVRFRFTTGSSWVINSKLRQIGKKTALLPNVRPNNGRTKDRGTIVGVFDAGIGLCLDLTVNSNNHLYLANAIQSHNTANFALLYGGGPASIVRATGCTQVEAQRRKQNFDKALPAFAKWVRNQKALCHKDKGVWTAFRRWIAIPEIDSQDKMIAAGAERLSINAPIQGCLYYASKILTNYGYLSIGHVLGNPNPEYRVWTGTTWAPFHATGMGAWERARVSLTDGTDIECDTRHKMILVTDEGYQWVPFESLKPGDKVATPLCEPVNFVPAGKLPKFPSNLLMPDLFDLWYWLGRYYGDGVLGKNRNTLTISFEDHEEVAYTKCLQFFTAMGLNAILRKSTHTPSVKESTRFTVYVQNKAFFDWVVSLGISPANAHTKRLPPRIFAESFELRSTFVRGMMDADGHKPPSREKGGKDNPYSIHLCQKPLLMDFKLLLRTLGVESKLRGPYTWVDKKKGREFTSYRLDINRRMYDAQVDKAKRFKPYIQGMIAPKFLVDNFLSKTPTKKPGANRASIIVLKSRTKVTGKVSMYTLRYLCQELGIELDYPIYAYKRVTSTEALGYEEETYTLRVQDESHRYEAEGVIHKNTGADIMKIAMVLLYKEFYKRRWLPSQEDLARMLMTVHDEIVFEIKHEILQEAMEVIIRLMEEPGRMAKWRVPLIAEALIDETWDAKYDWDKIMKGKPVDPQKPPKESDIFFEGRVYVKVPSWLETHLTPPWKKAGAVPPTLITEPSTTSVVTGSTTEPTVETPKVVSHTNGGTSNRGHSLAPPVRPSIIVSANEVRTFRISQLTPNSVRQVASACMFAARSNGYVLEVVCASTGEILVPSTLGIRVDTEEFQRRINEYNL